MKEYEKMIITATTANSWIYPDIKNWAETNDELVEDVVKCYEAGAAIAHVHLPRGEEQTKIATLSIAHGGNVRVGTENFPFIKKGVPSKNNAEIVARMVRISKEMGHEIADPSETRKILII